MLAAERRERIIAAARHDGVVRVADLVADLGCSQVTIRRDLDVLSDQGLLVKVHGGAVLPGSALSQPAPSDRSASPGPMIGVLIPAVGYFRHIVDGARSVAERRGGSVRLVTSGYDPEAEPQLVGELVDAGASGLLLAPSFARAEPGAIGSGSQDAERLGYLAGVPVPTVLIEREPPPTGVGMVSSVRSAHERGVAAAMAHLHALGHHRIALISRVFSQTGYFVERGFHQSITSLGLADDIPVITGVDPDTVRPGLSPEGPQLVFDRLMAARVTAVLCHGDEDALVLSQFARASGLAVPGDLSIVSYNDEVAAFGDPPITAVAPPREQVGAYAAELLLSMLDPDTINPNPVHVQLDPHLVVRGSTGAPAASARRRRAALPDSPRCPPSR